jgi:hypothetical protein
MIDGVIEDGLKEYLNKKCFKLSRIKAKKTTRRWCLLVRQQES